MGVVYLEGKTALLLWTPFPVLTDILVSPRCDFFFNPTAL